MKLKFYKVDGKVVDVLENVTLNQEEVKVGSVDAAKEKHVPEVLVEGNKVHIQVGEVIHPMLDNHYIEFVIATTNERKLTKYFKPGDTPVFDFELMEGEKLDAVYEHCNLHGVWVKE